MQAKNIEEKGGGGGGGGDNFIAINAVFFKLFDYIINGVI